MRFTIAAVIAALSINVAQAQSNQFSREWWVKEQQRACRQMVDQQWLDYHMTLREGCVSFECSQWQVYKYAVCDAIR